MRPAPQPAPGPAQSERQHSRTEPDGQLRVAASYVADALYDGWDEAVADRVAEYVTQQTWQRIRSGWPRRRCRLLARFAQRILDVKKQLHETAGDTAETLANLLGGSKIEQVFAAELAERIPLPWDTKLDTLAKSIQITGVMRCVAAGRNLRGCACFCDLAEAEGHEQVKQLLQAAATDYWTTHYQKTAVMTDPAL